MLRATILLISCLTLHNIHFTSASTGCVQLDEYTFDKVISKFDVSLVKFDDMYPDSNGNDYAEIGQDAKSNDKLLIAEVSVYGHGKKDNEKLSERFGVKQKDYPTIKLFVKGQVEPSTFSGASITSDALRMFIKKEGGIFLPLGGCIAKLDELAREFMAAKENKRQNILEKLERAVKQFDDKESSLTGMTYQKIMKRVLENGDAFIDSEMARVKKLMDAKLSVNKKKELSQKLNIFQSFYTRKVNEKEL